MSVPVTHLAQEAVAALVDGELTSGAAARAARHLAGCLQCRLAVEAQREAKSALLDTSDVAVPGDLLSRLQQIPFTADVPGNGSDSTLFAGGDVLTSSGDGGSWSVPLTPSSPPLRPGQARWFRRGLIGVVAGLGVGVAALAATLPGTDPAPDRPGTVARPVGIDERTEVVPPVVRTVTVGSAQVDNPGGTP